jgi:hypothetical protein
LAGFSLELLIVPNIKINTGSNATKYYVSFGLSDPTEMNDNTYTVSFPNNQKLMKLAGLKDIAITATTTNGTTGVVTLTANSSCGAEDLVALYPTEIIDLTPNPGWQVFNDTTGLPVTISSASVVAGAVALVTDATDHAPGDVLSIYMGDVSDLTAIGIVGFASSNTVTSLVV